MSQYTTGRDAQGNWYLYNLGTIPFQKGMRYYGSDTGGFDTMKAQMNSAGGQEVWEGDNYQGGRGNGLVPTGSGGGGGGQSFADTSAARNATQVSIDSLDQILANKNAEAEGEYNNIMAAYAAEDATNQQAYQKQVETNEQTREAQHQAGLLGAARGSRGLYATLASLGALNGTGRQLANRAVSSEANIDIGNANKTFDTNATTLFDTRSKLSQQEEQRKRDAKKIREDKLKANSYDKSAETENLWKTMSDHWAKAGNNSEAANAMGRASQATAGKIAASRPNAGTYATAPLQYSAPELGKYLAGANDMSVKVAGGANGPINGAIYTSTKDREKQVV
jgi:hypothetical protein